MYNFLKNYFSTILFIIIAYFFFTNNTYYSSILFYDVDFINYTINTFSILKYILLIYCILLIPFYFFETEESKARIVLGSIKKLITKKSYKISKIEKNCILTWLVKFFFVPLMLTWLIKNCSAAINQIYGTYNNIGNIFDNFELFFNNNLFYLILWIIMFLDVGIFTIGYMVESKYLNNIIKSVEPTAIGWIAALLCYPPFNIATDNILGWYSTTFPVFGIFTIHVFLNTIILLAFGLYVRASFALGFKASNLTNRGIVEKGPYKYIRHPAYIGKNIARMIGVLPILIISIKDYDFNKIILIILSSLGWFMLYYLRAITEEKHLGLDQEYIKYKEKVKYKFIPKVF